VVSGTGIALLVLAAVLFFGTIIPTLSASVRRLHDTDRTGWWYASTMIPILNYITSIVVLIFMLLDGTPHDNKYGPDPKGRG